MGNHHALWEIQREIMQHEAPWHNQTEIRVRSLRTGFVHFHYLLTQGSGAAESEEMKGEASGGSVHGLYR